MAAMRYSKQREAIRTYLLSTKSHPTAEAVYYNIKMNIRRSVWVPYIVT